MAKKLLFDLIASQPSISGDFHGGGKYAKKIFLSLLSYDHLDTGWQILGLFDTSKDLDGEIRQNAEQYNIDLVPLNGRKLPEIAQEYNISKFYTALPFGVINSGFWELCDSDVAVYSTIHGLRTLETGFPWSALRYYPSIKDKLSQIIRKLLEKKLVERDKKRYQMLAEKTTINAVSNHTKYSIISFFPNVNDISVFYSPDVTNFSDVTEPEVTDTPTDPYFLMVSGNRWLKNNLNSAIALDNFFSQNQHLNYKVIITGVYQPEVFLNRVKNKDRFIFYKYVSESKLRSLYEQAYALLYMSLNEGFGYPPLEAMKHGVPVIACPFTSVYEVCGDAVLYSNPFSEREIMCRLQEVLDADTYKSLAQKSRERYTHIHNRQVADLELTLKWLLN